MSNHYNGLNHSRNLYFQARAIGDREVERAKATPTAKQIKFFRCLCALCREHGMDVSAMAGMHSRGDYAFAINSMIERLKGAGVDVHGNGKDAKAMVTMDTDSTGNDRIRERIVVGANMLPGARESEAAGEAGK